MPNFLVFLLTRCCPGEKGTINQPRFKFCRPQKHIKSPNIVSYRSSDRLLLSLVYIGISAALFFFYGDLRYCSPQVFATLGSNNTTISRHHCHHFPTLSLEHLSLSLKSNLALHSLLTLS
jgi:hypothetical protein